MAMSALNITSRITSAVATYILNELVVSQDPAVRRIAEAYVWYIFPVVNPDGFVHSHDNRYSPEIPSSRMGFFIISACRAHPLSHDFVVCHVSAHIPESIVGLGNIALSCVIELLPLSELTASNYGQNLRERQQLNSATQHSVTQADHKSNSRKLGNTEDFKYESPFLHLAGHRNGNFALEVVAINIWMEFQGVVAWKDRSSEAKCPYFLG
ncbi:hypothetical protein HUJ05_008267 [Dendroctonus ponderosae]|nr:hypothetical protein HUJ05_008267 [Dendroctonus ponderosae]